MPATFRKNCLAYHGGGILFSTRDIGKRISSLLRDEEVMGKIIIDESLLTKLSQAHEEMELLDQHGGQVGFFFPSQVYLKMMRAWARAEFAGDQELQKARGEPGGMT